ncbi:MAG: CPBP family intramembrane glutamic endopeptidase [Bacteroidota bacterium]
MDVREDRFFPPMAKYLLLILAIFIGMLLSEAFIAGLQWFVGANLDELYMNLDSKSSAQERYWARCNVLIRHSLSFAIPALLTAIFLYRRRWAQVLDLNRRPRLFNLAVGCMLMLTAFPLAHLALWLNQQIPLPAWAVSIENLTEKAINGLLLAESPLEMLFNVLIIAILPAVGEELIFRGFIQKGLHRIAPNPHWAVWTAAFLFSIFHLQLEGFLPRMALGGLLGYMYYWTRNLWIPIAAHFINNGVQVIGQYFASPEAAQASIENSGQISWGITIISLIFVLGLSTLMINYNRNNQRS